MVAGGHDANAEAKGTDAEAEGTDAEAEGTDADAEGADAGADADGQVCRVTSNQGRESN